MNASPDLATLRQLLERRLDVIADHAFRDADPPAHLDTLRTVSEAIEREHSRLQGALPPRLEHFMTQRSYDKALAWICGVEA